MKAPETFSNMSYAYLFKYIIIGDTGEKVFINCAIWRIFQQVSFPPFVCVYCTMSCLGLWLSDVVMAIYLLFINLDVKTTILIGGQSCKVEKI